MRPEKRKKVVVLGVFLSGLLVDQLTKSLALKHFSTARLNSGLAWSLFSRVNPLWVGFLTSVVLIVLLLKTLKVSSWQKTLSLSLVLAGGGSNLFDRFFRSGVVDWISLPWWPVFNLADLFVILGLCWLGVYEFKKDF